MEYWRK